MKVFSKVLCGLLAALMLFSFVSCQNNDKTQPKDPASNGPSEPSNDENLKYKPQIDKKFNGETIKFFMNSGDNLNVRSIVLGEDDDPDYEVNQAVVQRNDKVQNELGVKIELAGTAAMQGTVEFLQPVLASKAYAYDVVGLYQYFDLGLALGDSVGSFYNYLSMPEGSYINVDAPYWNRQLLDTLSYKNVAFYITGDLSQSTLGTMYVSFVNGVMWDQFKSQIKELESSGGYDSVYDIVKNGYWTLDLWMDISNLVYSDTNNNDKIDAEDRIGVLSLDNNINNIMPDMLAAGSHVTYSSFDDEGKPKCAFNSPSNRAFAEKMYRLMCECRTANLSYTELAAEEISVMDIFAQGNSLITTQRLYQAESVLSDMEQSFYILPLPMFDHNQFNKNSNTLGYATQLHDSVCQFAICKAIGDEKLPAVTATMELMGYYSMTMVSPVYFDKMLKDRYTRNEEDKEMIDLTRAGIYSDFALMWAQRLDNVTWFFRQEFPNLSSAANKMKAKHNNITGKMKPLLAEIEEAFFIE